MVKGPRLGGHCRTGGGIQNGRFLAPRFGDRKKEAADSKNLGTPRTHRDASFLRSAHATASIAGRTGGLSASTMFGGEYKTDVLHLGDSAIILIVSAAAQTQTVSSLVREGPVV